MVDHPAWGVDVAAVGVRGVKIAKRGDGKPRIVAWDVVDFTEEVDDLQDLARLNVIGRGLFHFRSRHKLKNSRVWVSLRSEGAFNRAVRVPPVSDESLDRLLDYEAQQQVPYPLDEVHWDRRVLSIQDDGEVHAALYAIKKNLVEDRLRKMTKAGFPVDGLQLRALALHNFCAFERLLEPGTVVVDVDYASLHLLVHDGEETWFTSLPVGGVDFVQQVKETFHCDHRTAVKLVRGEKKAPDPELFEGLRREVAQDLVDEVEGRTRFFASARPGLKLSGIVLFQSHNCAPELAGALKRSLGLTVFRPKGFRHVEVDPGVVTAGIQEHFSSLARATGLALQGVGRAEVDVRLFPEGLERPIGHRRGAWVAAALLLVLLVAGAAFERGRAASKLQTATDAVAERFDRLEPILALEGAARSEEPLRDLAAIEQELHLGEDPAALVDLLWSRAAAPGTPAVVRLVWDGPGSPAARVVLAVQETAGLEAATAALDAFAKGLEGEVVREAQPEAAWIAPEPTTEAPRVQPDTLFRYRLAHRSYLLKLKEDA